MKNKHFESSQKLRKIGVLKSICSSLSMSIPIAHTCGHATCKFYFVIIFYNRSEIMKFIHHFRHLNYEIV